MILTKKEFDDSVRVMNKKNDDKWNTRIHKYTEMNDDKWKRRIDRMNKIHYEHIEFLNRENLTLIIKLNCILNEKFESIIKEVNKSRDELLTE